MTMQSTGPEAARRETKSLGATELEVSPIGLGLAALGRPAYINLGHDQDLEGGRDPEQLESHTHDVLDAAWEAGVRYFDAARSYGKSEQFLASWLNKRGLDERAATVGSKWGYIYTADWQIDAEAHEVKEHSLANLKDQWKQTCDHLGEHVQLYQIHSATFETGVLDDTTILDELGRLKAQGLHVGLTVSGPNQPEILDRALEIDYDGQLLFETVQITWNLLEQEASPAIYRAHDAGLGVIVKEALANGRLTHRNDDPLFANKLDTLRLEADRLQTTPDALAMAMALDQRGVDVVLSGAATVEQLHSNVRALDVDLDDEARQHLGAMKMAPEIYWDLRSDFEWN